MTDADVGQALGSWRERGYAVIRGLASPDTCATLRSRAEDLVSGRLPDPGLFFQRDADSGRYTDVAFGHGYEGPDVPYRKIERLERDPLFRAWLSAPPFATLCAAVFDGPVTLYRAALFTKVAQRGSELPWHQDGGRFWGLDRDPCLQAWTALDDAPIEAGCLEVVPGSHLRGLATPMGGLVPAAMADGVVGELVPVRAGDVVLLHNFVWHRSGANGTEAPRRGFSVSYLDGRTRCTRTRRAPRTFTQVFTPPGGSG